MAPDLRDCCQQALLDHWAVCDARPTLSVPCRCGHAEVLHGIRGNGSRGACSISTGAKAEPCGCSAFKADDGPAPAPDQTKQGGQHP
jgi:hypothetical protein